ATSGFAQELRINNTSHDTAAMARNAAIRIVANPSARVSLLFTCPPGGPSRLAESWCMLGPRVASAGSALRVRPYQHIGPMVQNTSSKLSKCWPAAFQAKPLHSALAQSEELGHRLLRCKAAAGWGVFKAHGGHHPF